MNQKLMGPGNRLELSVYLTGQQKKVPLVLALLIPLLGSCNRVSGSSPESGAPQAQKVTVAEHKPPLPPCPNAPYPVLQATALGTGHHKVFLKWNASPSASSTEPNSIGYCLYRTQTDDGSKRCPNHSACEKVTPMPVFTTRCVDDLVLDRTKYRYVAMAVNSQGISSPTNEAIADIPAAGQQNPAPSDAASYPSCRTPASPNQATH